MRARERSAIPARTPSSDLDQSTGWAPPPSLPSPGQWIRRPAFAPPCWPSSPEVRAVTSRRTPSLAPVLKGSLGSSAESDRAARVSSQRWTVRASRSRATPASVQPEQGAEQSDCPLALPHSSAGGAPRGRPQLPHCPWRGLHLHWEDDRNLLPDHRAAPDDAAERAITEAPPGKPPDPAAGNSVRGMTMALTPFLQCPLPPGVGYAGPPHRRRLQVENMRFAEGIVLPCGHHE